MKRFLIPLIAAFVLWPAGWAAASPQFYANCGDRHIFPQLAGSYSLLPAQGIIGSTFRLQGTGVPPSQPITVIWTQGGVDYIDAVDLGTLQSDAAGNLFGSFIVPTDTPVGPVEDGGYTILLVGPVIESYPSTECVTFSVVGGSVAENGYSSDLSEVTSLPATGMPPVILAGAALLSLGAIALKGSHRRH